jgi:Protein of unknown function (DUF2798)
MKNKIAFALIMGIITKGIISFTLISINIGFGERFFQTWLRSWGMAYLVVIPAILTLGPQIQKLVDYFLKQEGQKV